MACIVAPSTSLRDALPIVASRNTIASGSSARIAMPTRRIVFSRLALDARIGILEHERRATQPLHVDAEIDVDIKRAVDDHDIHSVLDYRALRETIVEVCTHAHVNLLETLTDQVASRLLAGFPEIRAVRVRISKPMAFADCAAVGVEVYQVRAGAAPA
jgi:dihydroneopterin aldolase